MARRALVVLEDGFDDLEYFYAVQRLAELGFESLVASHEKYSDVPLYDPRTGEIRPRHRTVKGKNGLEARVDLSYEEALERLGEFDVLVIPGGRSPDRARRYRAAVELTRRFVEEGKPVVAICHGPQLLISAGVVKGRRIAANPGVRDDVVNAGGIYVDDAAARDGNIVTIRHPSVLGKGFRVFVELLREKGLAETC